VLATPVLATPVLATPVLATPMLATAVACDRPVMTGWIHEFMPLFHRNIE